MRFAISLDIGFLYGPNSVEINSKVNQLVNNFWPIISLYHCSGEHFARERYFLSKPNSNHDRLPGLRSCGGHCIFLGYWTNSICWLTRLMFFGWTSWWSWNLSDLMQKRSLCETGSCHNENAGALTCPPTMCPPQACPICTSDVRD